MPRSNIVTQDLVYGLNKDIMEYMMCHLETPVTPIRQSCQLVNVSSSW